MTSFPEAMRDARLYRDLKYTEIADKAGRAKTFGRYLSQIESGKIRPSHDVIGVIAEAIGVEFYYRPGQGWAWRPHK